MLNFAIFVSVTVGGYVLIGGTYLFIESKLKKIKVKK
jgi:hypothetical protein